MNSHSRRRWGVCGAAVTAADQAHAETLAGLEFTDAERELMLAGVNDLKADDAALREAPLPNGFRGDGAPTSATFCGNVFRDFEAMLLARVYQDATGFQDRHPEL